MRESHHAGRKHIGRRVLRYASVDSTNTIAAGFADDPANQGLVVTADVQTAGRGQYGRAWQCPPGSGVLLSVVLFPPAELRRPAVLTAWAAVAVCETVRRAAGADPRIKWPNDVLVGGRKVCGILCEAGPSHVVVGIGLNANQTAADFEAMNLPSGASLATLTGSRHDVGPLSETLLDQLDEAYELLVRGHVDELERLWADRIGLIGTDVAVERMDGVFTYARLQRLSFHGVVLEDANGERLSLVPESIRHIHEV